MTVIVHNPQDIVRVQQIRPPVRFAHATYGRLVSNARFATYRFPLAIIEPVASENRQDTFTAENFVPFTVVMLIGTLCAAVKKY